MNRLKHLMHGTQTAADLLPEQSIVKKPEYSANVIALPRNREEECRNCGDKIPDDRENNYCRDWCYDERPAGNGITGSDWRKD